MATEGRGTRREASVYGSTDAADRYDETSADGWLNARERRIVDGYFPDTGGRVLDLGCGTGRTTGPLADRGYDVVGVDISEEMVARARERHPGVTFRVDDATDLSFDDGTFDYVLFSYYGIDCLVPEAARLAAMAEAHRVLQPGGRFAFCSHNRWYALPALVSDPGHFWTYYVANGNLRRALSRYRCDPDEYDLEYYRGSARLTRRQLRDAGFDHVTVVGKRAGVLQNFEISHYYVAETG